MLDLLNQPKLLGLKTFTYGKIDPCYDLTVMCKLVEVGLQPKKKISCLKGNWPGL